MNCNAFCGYQSIPFHCFLPSGAELELGRETRERKRGRWVRLMGMYSSIKTTVKVVVTTEQRGDSSDQELLVSSTLLSGEDRARVSLCCSPVHVTVFSVSVPKQQYSCYWQSHLYLWQWLFFLFFLAPDHDELFQLRWGRFYLQWQHLYPGWRGNILWELHFQLNDFAGSITMCAVCINVPVFICLTYSLTYITYLWQVTIIHGNFSTTFLLITLFFLCMS